MNVSELLGGNGGALSESAVWQYTRLKECYELTLDAADTYEVQVLMKQRLSALLAVGGGVSETPLTNTDHTVQSSISMIREALSDEDESAAHNDNFRLHSEINSLPESPEKQYFLALLSLREDRGNQGCSNALLFLERAINQNPGNMVYRVLTEVIHNATNPHFNGG